MRRARERALLVTALGIGLAGALLVVFAHGSTGGAATPEGLLAVVRVWAQVALAALACHVLLCLKQPSADQVLLPLSLALSGLGLAIIFSLDPSAAQRQMNWLWVSLVVFSASLLWPPDLSSLRDYRYLFGLLTALLLLSCAAFGKEIHGAKLWLQVGSHQFQPGELAKVTLVFFLAGYLETRGDMLLGGERRVLGLQVPEPRYLGPLLVMWGAGLLLLVALRDLGTALLFFGTFLAVVYAFTAQAGYLVVGGASFAAGAYACARLFAHIRVRLAVWLDPWSDIDHRGFQVVQGLFAIAAGGVAGVGLGLGEAGRIPAATTDFPFACVCEELGLWGAAMLLALYALWVYRALRLGLSQPERYRALLAVGFGCLTATQTLVILGGVTKLIPLTGITLPFFSYGGSGLVCNYLLLGFLMRCREGSR